MQPPRTLPLDAGDVRLVQRLREGLALVERPYAELAAGLGCSEAQVIGRLHRLLAEGALRYLGPLVASDPAGEAQMLAAMQVPEARFAAIAAMLGTLPEVVHSVQREHRFNLWFVIAGASPAALRAARARIETMTGLGVLALPRQKEFFAEWRLAPG